MVVSEISWLECAQVQKDLELVEAGLRDALHSEDPLVSEACTYLIRGGGKRLRPTLVLLAGQFGNSHDPQLLSMAAAMELIHLATLYHDDIVDEATTRRELPSANARWGNRLAAFAGDYILARATELFATAGDEVNRTVSGAIARVWEGQMRETESAYNLDLDENGYLDIIDKKTATFYKLPCRIGALVSGASAAEVRTLARFGRDLGIAFQLTDDVLDVVADQALLRKPPGSDLREGIYTLPVIYTLGLEVPGGDQLREILAQTKLSQAEVDEALAILRRNGSSHRTMETARNFAHRATRQLEELPDGNVKQSLLHLAKFIIERVELTGPPHRRGGMDDSI